MNRDLFVRKHRALKPAEGEEKYTVIIADVVKRDVRLKVEIQADTDTIFEDYPLGEGVNVKLEKPQTKLES